jgi:hypothetical protein
MEEMYREDWEYWPLRQVEVFVQKETNWGLPNYIQAVVRVTNIKGFDYIQISAN